MTILDYLKICLIFLWPTFSFRDFSDSSFAGKWPFCAMISEIPFRLTSGHISSNGIFVWHPESAHLYADCTRSSTSTSKTVA